MNNCPYRLLRSFLVCNLICCCTSFSAAQQSMVIGVDGLGFGTNGLRAANTPNIDSLRDGSWAEGYHAAFTEMAIAGGVLGAASQQPTVSGPGWSTILTGVWEDRHNVSDNTFGNPDYSNNPTYLETMEESFAEIHTVSVVNWSPIDAHIIATIDDANSSIDVRYAANNDFDVASLATNEIDSLAAGIDAAFFLQFDDVDIAGHICGSSGSCYKRAIEIVDLRIGRVLSAIRDRPEFVDEDWQVVLTSDHGHRPSGGHGGQTLLEREIPFIVSSRSVQPGSYSNNATPGVSHADVAPTVLDHLGVSIPGHYQGESRAAGVVKMDGKPGRVVLLTEDFERLNLGPNVEEDVNNPADQVWTKQPPAGWSIVDQVPGQNEPADNNGVAEWIGWSFADKDWWTRVAQDQGRSDFSNGHRTVAIADPDEWDDAPHPDSAAAGWYNTFLETPSIDLPATLESLTLNFDSSWRDEFDDDFHQTANIRASFDGGEPLEILLWKSDPNSPDFKDDATNESVSVAIEVPTGAESVTLNFGLFDAGNDWWWAIDNIEVSAGVMCGDFDLDGDIDTADRTIQTTHWTGALGIGGTATFVSGDCDGDGDVDTADQLGLVANWSGAQNAIGVRANHDLNADSRWAAEASIRSIVPEPSGLLMIAPITMLVNRMRRGRCWFRA